MTMHDCKQWQLPNEFSALGQLGYLRKSESMSGHVPVLFMCCEYHFLDGTIMNFLFLINSYSNFQESRPSPRIQPHHGITIVTMMVMMIMMPLMVS